VLKRTLETVFPWCVEWEAELTRLFGAYVERKLSHQASTSTSPLYWHAMVSDPLRGGDRRTVRSHPRREYQDRMRCRARFVWAIRPRGARDGRGATMRRRSILRAARWRTSSLSRQYAPPARVVALSRTIARRRRSRCRERLIAEGARQYRKTLRAVRGAGERPRYVTVADDQGQAEYVVSRVLEARERGVLLRRQAVLFRSSHHSDVLELELTRRNIPYVKYGGLKFLDAAHVKDLLAVLRWADNPRNRVAAFRALQLMPGMGPAMAGRCYTRFEAATYEWSSLGDFPAPPLAADDWPGFVDLMGALAVPEGAWQGQIERVREWYQPHLERIYEGAQVRGGDLLQLECIARQYATRERFLTELALDPPQATGDWREAYLDEDYLV